MNMSTARFIQSNRHLFTADKIAEANAVAGLPRKLSTILRTAAGVVAKNPGGIPVRRTCKRKPIVVG